VYAFGTRKLFVQLRNGVLVVRVGGGFVPFASYVDQHGAHERSRLRRLAKHYAGVR
jgi:hypothetical protein